MEMIAAALKAFFEFKAYVMLPIIVLIIGLAARMKLREALISSLRLAAGFAGVFMAFGYFVSRITPAVKAFVVLRGLDYPIVDVGWTPLAVITWSWDLAPLCILLAFGLNLAMLATKATSIVYIDVWNYWHFAFMGSLLVATGASLPLALLAVLAIAAYTIKVSEWSAPYVERECGLKAIGVSPHSVVGLLPYAVAVNKAFDAIPGFNKLSFDPSRKKRGQSSLLAEPIVAGHLVGIVLAIAAGYTLKDALELGVEVAAIMFILPACGQLMGRGMGDVSTALRSLVQRRFPDRELSMAMDTGVIMTNPSVIMTGLLLMPLSVLLAFILPGNKMIPLGDLPNLISVFSFFTLVFGGNIIRSVLAALPVVAASLLIASDMGPLITNLAEKAGMDFGAGGSVFNSVAEGGTPVRYWLFRLSSGDWIALVILPIMGFLLWLAQRESKKVAAALR
jgi:Phosphotransferase system, galactitol-specific IIC component